MRRFIISFILLIISFSANCQVRITMNKVGSIYYLPGNVNGLKLQFIFDTGASDVCISLAEALFMKKNGYLDNNDIIGTSYSQIANGEIVENTVINLKEIEIGGIVINNVRAIVTNSLNAPLLLGQSAIQKLGPIQLYDNILVIKNGSISFDQEALKYNEKGFQQIESGAYEAAVSTLINGLGVCDDPKVKSILFDNLGMAYYHLGMYDQAIEALTDAIAEDITNFSPAYNLGVYAYEHDDLDLAERAFKQVISKRSLYDVNNDYIAASYNYLGGIQLHKGELIIAESNLLESIRLSPETQENSYISLGDLYTRKGNNEQAIQYYKKGVEFQPDRPSNARVYGVLGSLYFPDDLENAYYYFKRSQSISQAWLETLEQFDDPQIAEDKQRFTYYYRVASFHIGRCAMRIGTGREKESLNGYNVILSDSYFISKFEAADYCNLYICNYVVNGSDAANAIADLIINKFSDSPEKLFLIALYGCDSQYYSTGIIDIYKQILRFEGSYSPIDFDYATVYNNIAWCYCCLGMYEEGIPYARKSTSLNNQYGFSWETLGELYFFSGNYLASIESMKKHIAIDGERKKSYYFIAKSYELLNNTRLAKKYQEMADNCPN